MDEPASGRSTFSTAPAPVVSPQPSGPRMSSGTELRHLRHRALRHVGEGGKARLAEEVAGNRGVPVAERGRAVRPAPPKLRAGKFSQYAGCPERQFAQRAAGVEAEHHVVAGLHRGHALPHRVDDAGALMPEHDRQRRRQHLVAHERVGVADAGRHHPHPHLAGPRLIQLQLHDLERFRGDAGDGGGDAHDVLLAGLLRWSWSGRAARDCARGSRPGTAGTRSCR